MSKTQRISKDLLNSILRKRFVVEAAKVDSSNKKAAKLATKKYKSAIAKLKAFDKKLDDMDKARQKTRDERSKIYKALEKNAAKEGVNVIEPNEGAYMKEATAVYRLVPKAAPAYYDLPSNANDYHYKSSRSDLQRTLEAELDDIRLQGELEGDLLEALKKFQSVT